MDTCIKAGVSGFLVSVVINLLSPIYLDLIPSFLVAILVTYIFNLRTFKEGLVAAFMTYIFTDGILNTIALATYYVANETYPSFTVNVWIMLSPVVSAVTAVIAAYVGVQFAQKMKPTQELPPVIPPQAPPA
jgi:hypothetical protein